MAIQIFISYRRDGGEWFAHLMYDRLRNDGYDVFLDVESLRSGKFNEALYEKIKECTDFLLILPPNGLARCKNEDDWVRLEIECAIKENKNIVPIMLRNFEFPKDLPESLKDLPNYNGIAASSDLFTETLVKLKEKRLYSKPVRKVKENITADEELTPNYDTEMDNHFKELFCEQSKGKDDRPSKLVQRITELKNEKFLNEITKLSEIKTKDDNAYESFDDDIILLDGDCIKETTEDKHFSLYNPNGFKTVIFKIVTKKDYKTLEKYNTCEQLDCIKETIDDKGGIHQVFFIGSADAGKQLVMLHFDLNKGEAIVNMGLVEKEKLRFSKNPSRMKFVYFNDENGLNETVNNTAFDTEALTEEEKRSLGNNIIEKWFTADVRDDVSIIIDPETGELVKREVFFDEETKEWKAKIKLYSYKSYFSFNLPFDNGKIRMPLSYLEIAACYCDGSYNFPKDILKAVEYYEKEESGEAFYNIARLFRSENDFADESIYNEYLDKAVELGDEAATCEKIIELTNSKKNKEATKILFEKLNDSESGIVNFIKGYLLEFGFVAGTLEEAFEYYYQSADNSYEPALARLCVKEKVFDKKLAYEYFLNSQEYGKTIAQYCIGCIFYLGLGVLTDKKKGLEFLKNAAEKGNCTAAYALFVIYDADAEYENKELAMYWLKEVEKIANQGNHMAAQALYNIYNQNSNFGNEEKALLWFKIAEKFDSSLT